MNRSSYIEMIKKMGFTEYEAKCYLGLFERESLTVSEISKLAGIPRPSAYEAVAKLMAKGLSVLIPGEIKRYTVADPNLLWEKSIEVIDDPLETELKELDNKRKLIMKNKKSIQGERDNMISDLKSLYKTNRANSSPLEYMIVLKDPLQILRKFIELSNEAQKEVLEFTKPPFIFKKAPKAIVEELKKVNDEATQRGVISRNIWDSTAKNEYLPLAKKLDYSYGNIKDREIDNLPIGMQVFDRKKVLYKLVDPVAGKSSVTCLITEHPDLANTFVNLFESFWEKATPMDVFHA